MSKLLFWSLAILLFILSMPSWANSLWCDRTGNQFSDNKARAVGDLLTVVIVQESSATTQAQHATAKSQDANAGAGSGLLKKFPGFGVKADRTTTGSGTSAASTRLTDSITVRVTEVLCNGNLRIEGTRHVKLEKDEMTLVFSGIVRQEDIAPDNSVTSAQIADQCLASKGCGPIAEKQHPGLLSRILSVLW